MTLQRAINFPVTVRGAALMAQVTEFDDNPIHWGFKIRFSNGYEDTFFALGKDFTEGTKESSKPYCFALNNDLGCLIAVDTEKFHYTFTADIDGEKVNVWIIESEAEEGEQVFNIYFKGQYQYSMKKINSRWHAKSVSIFAPEKIDQSLAVKVGHVIDSQL